MRPLLVLLALCPSVARAAEGGLFGPKPPATPPAPDASGGLAVRHGGEAPRALSVARSRNEESLRSRRLSFW